MRHRRTLAHVGLLALFGLGACPGPEPHAMVSSPAASGTGGATSSTGGSGGDASGGGGSGGTHCGDGTNDPGDLCYLPFETFAGGNTLNTPRLTDIDDDGDLDIVALSDVDGFAYVFVNNPLGSFALPTPVDSGQGKLIRVGRFSSDTLPDFITFKSNGPLQYIENGSTPNNVSFGAVEPITPSLNMVKGIAVGDIDGNALDDFVALRCADTDCVEDGDVDSFAFAAETGLPEDVPPFSAPATLPGHPYDAGAIANLDGGLRRDLIAADPVNGTIEVFFGLLGGTLDDMPMSFPIEPSSTNPNSIAVRDLDGVPGAELAISDADATGTTIAIMSADADGMIAARGSIAVGAPSYTLSLIDVDNDGNIDLVCAVAAATGGQVVVARGDGRGGFAQPIVIAEDESFGNGVAVGDLNLDGALDLVVRSSEASGIHVLMADP
jgi:hypothetical protein